MNAGRHRRCGVDACVVLGEYLQNPLWAVVRCGLSSAWLNERAKRQCTISGVVNGSQRRWMTRRDRYRTLLLVVPGPARPLLKQQICRRTSKPANGQRQPHCLVGVGGSTLPSCACVLSKLARAFCTASST